MSKKLLFNNLKAKATCPCCGSVEDECICTTLEELGATELELDFAISGKYANITYISSSSTYSYNSKSWQIITNGIKLSVLTSYNTKMAELGRVNATNYGTDYYGRYISDSNCVIYWNRTDYGTPNITLLNKLLAFTDEQLGHLKTYGKCVVPCDVCGETNCVCSPLDELSNLEVDWAIAMKSISTSFSSSSSTITCGGYTWKRVISSSITSSKLTTFRNKMTELGRVGSSSSSFNGTDYCYNGTSPFYLYWNVTLYGEPNITRLNELRKYSDEKLNQLNTYEKEIDVDKLYNLIINTASQYYAETGNSIFDMDNSNYWKNGDWDTGTYEFVYEVSSTTTKFYSRKVGYTGGLFGSYDNETIVCQYLMKLVDMVNTYLDII